MSGRCGEPQEPEMRRLGARTFAADPEQVRIARRWLAATLAAATGSGPGDDVLSDGRCDDAVLLLSEAMTNAVRHSGGDKIEIAVHAGGDAALIEVVDGGGGTLPHRTDAPGGESGRGLPIMFALARTWGYETVPMGGSRSG